MKIEFLRGFLPLLLMVGFTSKASFNVYFLQPRWDETLPFRSLEKELELSPIASLIPMAEHLKTERKNADFDNEVYFVVLQNGLKAVFKPGDDRYAEVAAYRASRVLDQLLVPPTVLRTINTREGSLQLYIESSVDLLKNSLLFDSVTQEDQQRITLFYYVFGQWDRGYGNRLIQRNNGRAYCALIDNAGMANRVQSQFGEAPFVCVGWSLETVGFDSIAFPFDRARTVQSLSLEEGQSLFKEFMAEPFLTRFCLRHAQRITYVLWQNALWVQMHSGHPENSKPLAQGVPQHIQLSYEKITKATLEVIWKEALQTEERQKYKHLIQLTLERYALLKKEWEALKKS